MCEFPFDENRYIIHVDLDCFYCQVEQLRLGIPKTVPVAVQQWGSLIAVNYTARGLGVNRFDHISAALQKCPTLVAVHTATYALGETTWKYHTKPNKETHKVSLDSYREASRSIHKVLIRVAGTGCAYERAGVDESYIDVTSLVTARFQAMTPEERSSMQWCPDLGNVLRKETDGGEASNPDAHNEIQFQIAATIAKEMRDAVFNELRYECSAGIASNKALAKLGSSKFKPNQQTVILDSGVPNFIQGFDIRKLRGFGGDFGKSVVEKLCVAKVCDLMKVPRSSIETHFTPDVAKYIQRSAFGHFENDVTQRTIPKSVLANKQIKPTTNVMPWITMLCAEVANRTEQFQELYGQSPKQFTLVLRWDGSTGLTRSVPMPHPLSPETLVEAMKVLIPNPIKPCHMVGVMAQGFSAASPKSGTEKTLTDMWKKNPIKRERELFSENVDHDVYTVEDDEEKGEVIVID